ncbi:alpha-amylase family glycosyl hydrolase [Cupriavidus sp. 30B13]|uniref:alpha-amylase family glycosyl hydrolase n=1 Tax=Cupriavidus sp. 30B13 TaxID=3384241 RepID=UPI003B8FE408
MNALPSQSTSPPVPSFGPCRLDDGRTRFRLWAPGAAAAGQAIRLEIAGMGPVPMCPPKDDPGPGEGWLEAVVPCCPGARYWFRLDDGTIVPDPAARAQAADVDGASLLCDPAAYAWCHPFWLGRPWPEAVIYEMHVGLCGGYAGAARQLPRLAALGFTAVELMPLAEFPGGRNWGYDGVLPFAPESSYGTPDELRALVDCAHGLGMMVLLDVVYNHFGPEGNFLPQYAGAFFRDDVRTPWGPAIDFRRPEVRRFFTENALYWLDDFRFDGLRLDAVHAIADEGWLPELAGEIRARHPARHIHLVLENDDNDAGLLAAGYDAQWNDDGHHALHVLLTGEQDGYYGDYGDYAAPAGGARWPGADTPHAAALDHLARVLAEGFAYQGETSPTRSRPGRPGRRGQPSAALPPTAFVLFLQNHDQTGNRALGERLASLAGEDALRAAVLLQLLCPQVPLVFMGEEYGAATPFLYFTSHPPALAEAVREGRRREFGAVAAFADPARAALIPDPNDPATFEASRPPLEGDNAWSQYYRALLAARRRELAPRLAGSASAGVRILGERALAASWRLGDGALLTIWINFGDAPAPSVLPGLPAAIPERLLAQSREGAMQALAGGTLLPASAIACLDGAAPGAAQP